MRIGYEWNPLLTRFVFLEKDASQDCSRSVSYDDLEFFEQTLSTDEFVGILSELSEKNLFRIPGKREIVLNEASLQRYPMSPSNYQQSGDSSFGLSWASNLFLVTPKTQINAGPNGPFAKIDQPLFDSPQTALRTLFGFETGYFPWRGGVLIALPNYSARIEQIRLGPKRATVKVAIRPPLSYSDLTLKAYFESPLAVQQKESDVVGDETVFETEFSPFLYLIYLFSKKTREVLDFRRFGAGWSGLKDVIVETTPENIEQIISHGESNEVEFKQYLPKKAEEFAETVVAMSNGQGGTVLIGVDDNGIVVGVEDPKISDSIHDILRNYCEPAVEPKITTQLVSGKTVCVVQITRGDAKPYFLKGKGPYVRFGASDRLATREETISLMSQKNANNLFG